KAISQITGANKNFFKKSVDKHRKKSIIILVSTRTPRVLKNKFEREGMSGVGYKQKKKSDT
ncbi:MAG: hypothetical protein RSA97_09140, partial [Oscillospiraceae bacterium]